MKAKIHRQESARAFELMRQAVLESVAGQIFLDFLVSVPAATAKYPDQKQLEGRVPCWLSLHLITVKKIHESHISFYFLGSYS